MSTKQPIIFAILITAAIISLFQGCKSGIFDQRISEGTITFNVTYPSIDPDDMLAGLMPDKMEMKFKDNRFVSGLSAGMGMFKTQFFCNSNDHTLINSVKLINKKYATSMDQKAANEMNNSFQGLSVIKLEETEVIAGLDCKKALIVFPDIRLNEVYVYYTNDIKFEDPNWGTFFKDIDGVLLEYRMVKYDIVMHFRAEQVVSESIDNSVFELPEGYEFITSNDLEDEINAIFKTFQ